MSTLSGPSFLSSVSRIILARTSGVLEALKQIVKNAVWLGFAKNKYLPRDISKMLQPVLGPFYYFFKTIFSSSLGFTEKLSRKCILPFYPSLPIFPIITSCIGVVHLLHLMNLCDMLSLIYGPRLHEDLLFMLSNSMGFDNSVMSCIHCYSFTAL